MLSLVLVRTGNQSCLETYEMLWCCERWFI